MDLLARPGPEAHGSGLGQQSRSRRPNRRVEAVNGDVLHGFGAQKMDEVHLDPTDAHLQLHSTVKEFAFCSVHAILISMNSQFISSCISMTP